nr:immunoglobulin heavy chain junction region [Mus musculus]
CTRLFYAMDYW